LNYRHIFHAGNFGDVLKHNVLMLLVSALKEKPGAFVVLDTHAGVGLYDLTSQAALQTNEHRDGIARVLQLRPAPAVLAPYLDLVRHYNPGIGKGLNHLKTYPGSPEIARRLLRNQDRLIAVERHPEEVKTLRRRFGRTSQVTVLDQDGYLALKGLLPPAERRGLVLIDPPFEKPDEFEKLLKGVKSARRRWATGIYAIWFPIKAREPVEKFLGALVAEGANRALLVEMLIWPEDVPDRLRGCGMVVINPPWQIDVKLLELTAALAPVLGRQGPAKVRVEWLAGE
jgi:23S rRNA (adenine2030-N6)-methyltransferase